MGRFAFRWGVPPQDTSSALSARLRGFALFSSGYVAELYQGLDHASRTGSEDPSSNCRWTVRSSHNKALFSGELLPAANNSICDDRLACGYGDKEFVDTDIVMSSPVESENDDDDDDDVCDIISNLIADAAALAHYHSQPQSFEEIFAQEESLFSYDGLDDFTPSSSRSSPAETPCPRAYTSSPSTSEREEWVNEGPNKHIPIQWADRDGQDGVVKGEVETERLRLSDKKDLMPSEISVVARRLIKKDSVTYFLNNCRLIYETLIPSLVQQPSVCHHNGCAELVIAAFDTIQGLINGKDICRLLLRFAYMHLV